MAAIVLTCNVSSSVSISRERSGTTAFRRLSMCRKMLLLSRRNITWRTRKTAFLTPSCQPRSLLLYCSSPGYQRVLSSTVLQPERAYHTHLLVSSSLGLRCDRPGLTLACSLHPAMARATQGCGSYSSLITVASSRMTCIDRSSCRCISCQWHTWSLRTVIHCARSRLSEVCLQSYPITPKY
jgi:hypothetical protein